MALIVALIAVVLIACSYRLSRYLWATPLPTEYACRLIYLGGMMDVVTLALIAIAIYLWLI